MRALLNRLLWIALLTLFACTVQAAEGTVQPVIQVRPVVEVDGQKEITLGDLIEMRGVGKEIERAIRDVRLADAPGPGETRSFTDVGLAQILRVHLREVVQKTGEVPSLKIPSRVTVVRKSFQLRNGDVEQEIKNQLKPLCADCEFEISSLSLPAVGSKIPADATWSLKMRPEIPKGSFSVPLEVLFSDATRRLFWVSGTLAVRRLVPVASRAINIGEKMRPEDFTVQSRDVTFASDLPASSTEINDSVASRQIAAGEIVWRSQLRREMAIKYGDLVKVVVGGEGWQVSTDGVAQGQGYVGDMIRVKVSRTQKVVSGLLKEKGLIEVQ